MKGDGSDKLLGQWRMLVINYILLGGNILTIE